MKTDSRPSLSNCLLAALLVVSLTPLANLAGGSTGAAWADAADAADATGAAGAAADTTGAAGAAADTDVADANPSASDANGATAAIAEKEEVIYALLKGGGAPHSGYVVNHFQVDSAGTLRDHGSYQSVANLSTTSELSLSGNTISGPVEKGDFYYEGILDTVALPWLVDVSYLLDGRPVEAEDLAGASGQLEINIKTRQNTAVEADFFEHYLLQIQLTLDATRVKTITAPDATIANAGQNKQVAFMVLPGKEGDLTLRAQVTDFEMSGIQISGLPFSMVFDIPDTADMVKDMTKLSDAIGELNEGVGKLQNGAYDMKSGAADLAAGSADLNEGLSLLSDNSSGLTQASSQINSALATIVAQLEGGAVDPSQIEQLIGGLRQLAAGLSSGTAAQPGLAEGLTQVQGGISSATTAMDGQMGALTPVSDQVAIGTLLTELPTSGLSAGSQATVGALLSTNTQAAYVRGAWYGPNGNDGVKAGLEAATAGLTQSIGSCQYMAGQLNTIADGLESGLGGITGLQTLVGHMKQLSSNYASFNEGLGTYAGGVDTLATNYRTFNNGLAQFAGGVDQLYGGISDLHGGTGELYTNVEDLPETMQKEIDSFLRDYQQSDFTPRSFLSAENEHIERVQFILLTDAIKLPTPPADTAADEPADKDFWSRLISLFTA
jgi:X-X-X-Leu-X-X-Gly heptad repeat protein